jgi:hypothetical protein
MPRIDFDALLSAARTASSLEVVEEPVSSIVL